MRRGMPSSTAASTETDDLEVQYMDKDGDGNFFFGVEDANGVRSVMTHETMTTMHSLALIRFYESKLKFV